MIPSCCVSCASVRPACCQVSRHHEPSTTADSASRSQTMATFQSSTNRLALLVVGLLAVMGQSAEQRPHLRGLAQVRGGAPGGSDFSGVLLPGWRLESQNGVVATSVDGGVLICVVWATAVERGGGEERLGWHHPPAP